MNSAFQIRPLQLEDSLEELTQLLNRAYAPLAEMGLQFVATWQDVTITRKRVEAGICFVAELDGKLVGTGTLYAPEPEGRCEAYRDLSRWHFGQFAVDPDLQRSGLGSQLLAVIEQAAAERSADEIALDTAEGATHLIDYYRRRGYEPIGTVDWESTNYVSVVMSKKLR